MTLFDLNNIDMYSFAILPLLIFVARICDVTLGTIRIIFISKGIRYLAPIVGFFEILIWLLAIGQIMQNFSNFYYYFFYAGGFATGTFVGILIEEKLSIGMVILRVITGRDITSFMQSIKTLQYQATVVDAQGSKDEVKIIFTVVKRRDIKQIIDLVKKFNPNAFYSIEDVKSVSDRAFISRGYGFNRNYLTLFRKGRKGK